jgi:GNAT superfamily N-acetyltransferase
MNDLFVAEVARGNGVADALIAECAALCRARGAVELGWRTAKDNVRAQAVYERVGGERSEWVDYSLPVPGDAGPG